MWTDLRANKNNGLRSAVNTFVTFGHPRCMTFVTRMTPPLGLAEPSGWRRGRQNLPQIKSGKDRRVSPQGWGGLVARGAWAVYQRTSLWMGV